MTTGEKLRALRDSIGVNQTQLASSIGFAPSFVSGIERGVKDPSREFLQQLLDTYGVNLNWFLGSESRGEMFVDGMVKGKSSPEKSTVRDSGELVPSSKSSSIALQDAVYMNANGHQIVAEDYVAVALLPQRVSAGPGQEVLDYDTPVGMIPVLRRMLWGRDPRGAFGAEVKGDSMTGERIFEGDVVIFYRGLVTENGLYVLFRDGRLFVKRLTFSFTTGRIKISSANDRYPEVEEVEDSQALSIAGKLLGWVHVHPY